MKNKTHILTFMVVLLALITSACSSATAPKQTVDGPVGQDTSVTISNTGDFTLTSPDLMEGNRLLNETKK
jgi:PBP1b-binding outer membrane lipoprotein LpoB